MVEIDTNKFEYFWNSVVDFCCCYVNRERSEKIATPLLDINFEDGKETWVGVTEYKQQQPL